MSKSKKHIIIFFIGLAVYFSATLSACKQDDDNPTVGTPYDLDVPFYFGDGYTIPGNNPLTKEGVKLGRFLFYEKALSVDSSISCGSCHNQSLAFTDGQAFSTGFNAQQTNRSSMALFNLMWSDKFFWDGHANSLEEQALMPIQNPVEMNSDINTVVARLNSSTFYKNKFEAAFGTRNITANLLAKAIAQFERTLISDDAKFDKYLRGEATLTPQELSGKELFLTHPEPSSGIRGGNCGDCHGSALITLNGFHNNGLDETPTDIGLEMVTGNPSDKGKFKAPSLRNIALTAPYMHDGRFTTLEEVLDHYNSHIQDVTNVDPLIQNATNQIGGDSLLLTDQEKQDIIAFLQTLTDNTFITNPEFSDPN